tara:strand:- start:107 stop:283 length:177 start_codon:yes stop_codon:yes gene_type:complete
VAEEVAATPRATTVAGLNESKPLVIPAHGCARLVRVRVRVGVKAKARDRAAQLVRVLC